MFISLIQLKTNLNSIILYVGYIINSTFLFNNKIAAPTYLALSFFKKCNNILCVFILLKSIILIYCYADVVPKLGICPILRLAKPNLESTMLPNLKIGQLHNLKIGLPKLGIIND